MAQEKQIDQNSRESRQMKVKLVATDAHPFAKEKQELSVHPSQVDGLKSKGWAVEPGKPTKAKDAKTLKTHQDATEPAIVAAPEQTK